MIPILILKLLSVCLAGSAQLNEFIGRYEVLSYNERDIHDRHLRVRRSIEPQLEIKFSSHGRDFHLQLKPNKDAFSKNFKIETGKGQLEDADTSHIYKGVVANEPNSLCHGGVINGVFRGTIHREDGQVYFVEPADEYFADPLTPDPSPRPFHSIIYEKADIQIPENFGGCGVKNRILEDMRKVQQDVNKETFERQEKKSAPYRHKRDASNDLGLNTCEIFLQTDHKYYERYKNRETILINLAGFIESANNIFKKTLFGNDHDVGLAAKKIKIYTEEDKDDPSYLFASDNIGVEKFLDLASMPEHDDYCLAYIFTHRDFEGTVGLAWVGTPLAVSSGGICSQSSYYSTYGGYRSLNTGLVTVNNFGVSIPDYVSQLVFAHELGHSFGSPHDEGSCLPADENFYLMYPMATDGHDSNNDDFSPCSINSITAVLDSKRDFPCFIAEEDAMFCGNSIIEGDEECDCGYEQDCHDECCVPQNEMTQVEGACRYKPPGAECSPQQGPCCDPVTCLFNNNVQVCQVETDCAEESTCSGFDASCPVAPIKDDTNIIYCDDGRNICDGGSCNKSICETQSNTETCQCTEPKSSKEELCHICCQLKGQPETCQSWSASGQSVDLFMDVGSSCDGFQGYCDFFNKCRRVDEEGPLASLLSLIFIGETGEILEDIRLWLATYWWVVLLVLIGVAALMTGMVYLCAAITPTDNPMKGATARARATPRDTTHPDSKIESRL